MGFTEKLERNKKIVTDYLFNDVTLQAMADEHSISRERCRQILERYGVTFKPQNKLRIRMRRLLNFIIKYKIENDGNSPGKVAMIKGAKMSTATRIDGALTALEREGKITFSYTHTGNRMNRLKINVIGAKWLPPPDYEEIE